jgi:hypothetical protein
LKTTALTGGACCHREREREGAALGRDDAGPWAHSGHGLKGLPRPFNSFSISFSISFLFFFCYFAKHFQIDFKQLLKLVIHFPSVC